MTLLKNNVGLCVLSIWVYEFNYKYDYFFFKHLLGAMRSFVSCYRSINEDVCIMANLCQETCFLCSIVSFLFFIPNF